MLTRRKWAKNCLRANIAKPDQITYRGKVKIAELQSEILPTRETELRELIKDIAPEWDEDETQILLNKNVTCKKHIDGNNAGHSYILWVGNFVGGALVFEDGVRLEEKNKWHKIYGQIPHWNETHEGDKYSIILFRRLNKNTKQEQIAGCLEDKRNGVIRERKPKKRNKKDIGITYDCPCGGRHTKTHTTTHAKTIRHINWLSSC